jgi:putative salt-induced outer membrane protein YdiY
MMMKNHVRTAGVTALLSLMLAPFARAQQPAAAGTKALTGSAGAGLSLTQGNSDTLNITATIDSLYDPKTKNVMKWAALFMRGKQNGVLTVNRVSATFRDENAVNGRMFLFAQIDTMHDTFKAIDYLYAPAAGVGYKVIDSMRSQLAMDVGAGGVVEKDSGASAHAGGAITMSEKLVHQLTETTTLKQSATSLLKVNDFGDGLFTFQAGVAAKINGRFQLSVDVLDTFKNRPLDPTTKRSDVALVTSIIAKY